MVPQSGFGRSPEGSKLRREIADADNKTNSIQLTRRNLKV
jgi:hypothetical protein